MLAPYVTMPQYTQRITHRWHADAAINSIFIVSHHFRTVWVSAHTDGLASAWLTITCRFKAGFRLVSQAILVRPHLCQRWISRRDRDKNGNRNSAFLYLLVHYYRAMLATRNAARSEKGHCVSDDSWTRTETFPFQTILRKSSSTPLDSPWRLLAVIRHSSRESRYS